MASRRPQRPRAVEALAVADVADEATQRALTQVTVAVKRLQGARDRALVTADLTIGTNKLPHGLGRAVDGYALTATVASAAFAHALNLSNPHPEREVWIDVVGVNQPGARVEVF